MEQVLLAIGSALTMALHQYLQECLSKPQTDEQKLIDEEMRADVALYQADPHFYEELH